MVGAREKVAEALEKCIVDGGKLLVDVNGVTNGGFVIRYQRWYTRSLRLVEQLAPERFDEFRALYKGKRRQGGPVDADTYDISDYLLGLRIYRGDRAKFDAAKVAASRIQQQFAILGSLSDRLDDVFGNVRGLIQAELLDGELEGARELRDSGHMRAACMVAGVALERHLATVCEVHGIRSRKKRPTLSDWNDALKKEDVVETAEWRRIQYLGDLRNKAAHPKEAEPTEDDVTDLIEGTVKTVKTLF